MDLSFWFGLIVGLAGAAVAGVAGLVVFLSNDNLAPPVGNSSDERPHQRGNALGKKRGHPTSVSVEWMVDTGAQIACIKQTTGNNFDLVPAGGSASATTGGGGLLVKSGLTTEFEVLGYFGLRRTVRCRLPVAVKPNDAGSEILGMDQIKHAQAVVEWEPQSGKGRLRLS